MELDFNKYCVVDGSPTTVLPAPPRSKVANRKSSRKPKCQNDMLPLHEDFVETRFDRYSSASCNDAQSRRSNQDNSAVMKRGSVYQSTKEVRQLQSSDTVIGRKKIEFSRESAQALPFEIIDSLCGLDEDAMEGEQDMFSEMSLSERSTSSFSERQIELCTWDSVSQRIGPQIVPSSDKREKQSSDYQALQGDHTITSDSVVASVNGRIGTHERSPSASLHKSISAKFPLPRSPVQSVSDGSKSSSPNVWLSHARQTSDPFKSRSHRSPLSRVSEAGLDANKTLLKSLPNDPSDKPPHVGYVDRCEKKENHDSALLHSPAHLHGLLRLKKKHGVPVFEFSVKSPEDVYVAKAWKAGNSLTWLYAFHPVNHKRRSNASGLKFRDINRESSMVGQMLVSCRLCTESKGDGASSDSMLTEFVLYDIAHSRKSTASQDNSSCSPDIHKPTLATDEPMSQIISEKSGISTKTKDKVQVKHSGDSAQPELSTSQPLAGAELHPGLEIAATVIQVPFEKRESLKFKNGDRKMDTVRPKFRDLCQIGLAHESVSDTGPGKMHVVIPAGIHSLPSTANHGPLPLLERWRLGGGCDCGGWDMACPLSVFRNQNFNMVGMDCKHPAVLFAQGKKDNLPAFSMRVTEKDKYAVDFHAQLSSLQAFSISVAVLHATQASEQERSRQNLLHDSPTKELKILADAFGEDAKLTPRTVDEILPSFVINPPFSPIARV